MGKLKEIKSKLEEKIIETEEKIFRPLLKTKLGYPIIGLFPGSHQLSLAKKHNVGKWTYNACNLVFNLSLASSFVLADYALEKKLGKIPALDYFAYGWMAKSICLNSARGIWMATSNEPKGELAVELAYRVTIPLIAGFKYLRQVRKKVDRLISYTDCNADK